MLVDRRNRRRQPRDVAKQSVQSEMTATLSPSATTGSVGSPSRAPSTVVLLLTSDANVAWLLANAADVCLRGHERTMTYVELGCGEHHLAIERILNAVISSSMPLPVAIFETLTRWIDEYADSAHEPRLRRKLAQVRIQQVQPASLLTQLTPCGDVGDKKREPCEFSHANHR
jgi:hypothetical protein